MKNLKMAAMSTIMDSKRYIIPLSRVMIGPEDLGLTHLCVIKVQNIALFRDLN